MVSIVQHFDMRLRMKSRHLSSCIGEMYQSDLLRAYSQVFCKTNACWEPAQKTATFDPNYLCITPG